MPAYSERFFRSDTHRRVLLVALLLALISGCAAKEPAKVTVEPGSAVMVAQYRTYDWRSAPSEGTPLSPTVATRRDWRIRAVMDQLLAAKGYGRSTDAPDFLVDYELTETDKQVSSFGDYIGYYRAGGVKGPIDAFTLGYTEGALMLGIFDVSTRQLVWRASATVFTAQEDSDVRLEDALRQMLERLPLR